MCQFTFAVKDNESNFLTKQTFVPACNEWHKALFPDFATLSIRIEHPIFQFLLMVVLQISIPNRLFSQAGVYNVYNEFKYSEQVGICNPRKEGGGMDGRILFVSRWIFPDSP